MIDEILKEVDYKMIIIDKIDLENNFNINTIYENHDLEKSKVKVEMILKEKGLILIIENIKLKEILKKENEISLSIIGSMKGNGDGVGFSLTGLKIVKIDENEIIAFTNLEDNLSRIYKF